MSLPTFEDFALFSSWDAWLWALFFVVCASLCRFFARMFDKAGRAKDADQLNKVRVVCWIVAGAFVLVGIGFAPSRGPGVYGVAAIGGTVLSYLNAIWFIRTGKPLV